MTVVVFELFLFVDRVCFFSASSAIIGNVLLGPLAAAILKTTDS